MLVILQPARSQRLSAGLRHDSWRLPESAKIIHQCQVLYQLPILSLERAFFISPKVDSLHFFRGSQKCFVCVSPNHYLTKSLQITLLLSGMQIVEFSASVDAF